MRVDPAGWRVATTNNDIRHIVEVMLLGTCILYCRQMLLPSSVPSESITIATPPTCLWCAAWWNP